MQTRNTVLMVLALAVVAVCGVLVTLPTHRLPCGHKISLFSEWFPRLRPHGLCPAGSMVRQMRALHDSWDQYESALKALSKKQEDTEYPPPPKSSLHSFDFPMGGTTVPVRITTQRNLGEKVTTWECRIDPAGVLPGYYLMTGDGTVYFNEHQPASAGDEVLPR